MFEQLELLRRRTSAKWRMYPDDVLPLFVAEMDTPTAPPVRAALEAAIDLGDVGYPFGPALPEAFTAFAGQRWGWRPEVSRQVVLADVLSGVAEAIKLVSKPGATVVLPVPAYHPFFSLIPHLDRVVAEVTLGPTGRLDLARLESAFRAAGGGSVFVLCNPYNPTGVVHTPEELAAVAELANRHGLRVVADEIHGPLVLNGATFTPFLTVPGAETAFAATSASKGWNLAGIKCGLLIAGEGAAEDLARLPEPPRFGATQLGVIAHTAALRDGGGWLDELLAALADNRRLLGDLLAEQLPAVRWQPPEATFLAWLDCRALGLGDDPAAAFLEKGRVAPSSGPMFGSGGAGHVRFNFATSPEILAEAIRRMASAVA